ncbi:HTH-type transcriptional regulator CynR [Falsiruegeria litorea R37]|uniref:HTH-type transcriptional regulator CynR n=1 Tax=Falsiruegeria litorea R37 TaxID=1200284 RepID=A0A1Y5TNQ4_9RHOB|nr:LysR family transcriptional regulator [Falsiruegeria litorea]SLN68411.1 HTH-type transcriptional regulator CynR [Falsiruegeria litorea R37]
MSINYDFGDLEAFLAVKETGSFHRAAERLNLSQSAVSRRVQKLEDALGSVLFERTTRAVVPTLAAKRLQARAEAILEDAQETARAMRDESVTFAYQRGAIITVAAIPTVLRRLIAPALVAFSSNRHAARVRILDGTANEVAEAVAQGEADFGLGSIPMLEPTTEFEPLFDEQIVLAVPNGHKLAADSCVSPTQLAKVPLIFPSRGTGNRLLIDEAFARARIELNWTYEAHRTTTSLQMVEEGLGAALLPQSAVGAVGVSTCRIQNLEIARPIGLLSRLGQADSRAVLALKRHIRETSDRPTQRGSPTTTG